MTKRFVIHCTTNWVGMDNDYPYLAESEEDLYQIADELAQDNLDMYDMNEEIARCEGYNVEEMTDEDWDEMWDNVDMGEYCSAIIEEFEGDEELWKSYGEPIEI